MADNLPIQVDTNQILYNCHLILWFIYAQIQTDAESFRTIDFSYLKPTLARAIANPFVSDK